MFVIYLTVPLSARFPLSTTLFALEVAPIFARAMLGHLHAFRRVIISSKLAKYPWTNISSHNTVTLARIYLSLLRPHVQIDRANELEERIIIRFWFSFFQPLVPPDQQTHEDLDLLQCEVEADTHSLASRETGSAC